MLMSGGGMDGYTSAMYFIVTPAVLGPVAAVLLVVAVYVCRRRQRDADPSSPLKHAPAATYRQRSTTTRHRDAVEAGTDEETQTMLPGAAASGRLVFSSPALYMPGEIHIYILPYSPQITHI